MKQQIIIIHGGTTFDTYKEYVYYLHNKELSLEKLKPQKEWKDTLQKKLGNNYEVLLPRMPNGTNAKYKEWEIWFKRVTTFVKGNVILIGHSLGGIFLAKYLSKNNFPKVIKATILVGAPYDDDNSEESLGSFNLPPSLLKLARQGGMIYLFQSKDDPVVTFKQVEKYKKALPNAKTMIFDKRGHFKQASFPEIVKLIQTLQKRAV